MNWKQWKPGTRLIFTGKKTGTNWGVPGVDRAVVISVDPSDLFVQVRFITNPPEGMRRTQKGGFWPQDFEVEDREEIKVEDISL